MPQNTAGKSAIFRATSMMTGAVKLSIFRAPRDELPVRPAATAGMMAYLQCIERGGAAEAQPMRIISSRVPTFLCCELDYE